MHSPVAGFREIEHTADWQLEVWGPDLLSLLEQAARGMYTLAGIKLEKTSRYSRQFSLPGDDPERLLVSFLAELLWIAEQENLAFDAFQLTLDGERLNAYMEGSPIAAQRKEIKVVTYHNLAIQSDVRGLSAKIVFDV